jgi:hypothetical protein
MARISGHVDSCQQSHLTGWAVSGETVAEVSIFVNGSLLDVCRTDVSRPDVASALENVPEKCGFAITLPRSLRASDEIEVIACDRYSCEQARIPCNQHRLRSERLAYRILREQPGLEIGALNCPFLDKTNFNVQFVDHACREDLIAKYKHSVADEGFRYGDIVDADIVWKPGEPLSSTLNSTRFAYVCASQVIEHIADPIGWLNDLGDCLETAGRINLSIPDSRFTFDHCRRPSSAADMIDAHMKGLKYPNFRQVLDHILYAAPLGTCPSFANAQNAYDVAILSEQGTYVDAHCHVWTFNSFVECWSIISRIGLSALTLDQAWEPIEGANEFIVSFLKT